MYVLPPAAVRFNVCPAHNGPFEDAVAEGNALTTAFTVAVAEHPFTVVTVTVYAPEFAVVAATIIGFCWALL